MRKIYFIIAVLCIASLFASCNQEQSPDVIGFGDEVEVEMSIVTATQGLTRAYIEAEDKINDLTVLVFKVSGEASSSEKDIEAASKFVYFRHAWLNSGTNYRAVLKTGSNLRIYLAANSKSIIENANLVEGDTYASVRDKLILIKPDELKYNNLPMWGIVGGKTTISESDAFVQLGKVNLLRSVASVDLDVALDKTVFELESASIVRATDQGFLVHKADDVELDGNNLPKIKFPSVPDETEYDIDWESTDISNVTTGHQEIANKLYMFENDATATTCPNKCYTKLIIKGEYKGTSYYYPLSFRDDENEGEKVQAARNRKFIITVTAVNGPGFTDKEDAINSEDVNIDFKVIEWNKYEDETTLYVDGDKYVSFIDGKSILLADKKDSDALRWFTTNALKWNGEDPTNLKWTFENNFDDDSKVSKDVEISNNRFHVELLKDITDNSGESYYLKVTTKIAYSIPAGANDHNATLKIRIGNIQFDVKLRQVENAWIIGNEQEENL